MPADSSRLSVFAALAVAAFVLVAANAVSSVAYSLGIAGMTVEGPVAFLGRTVGQFATSMVRAVVLVGGVAAAVHLGRPSRTLLAVTPVAFVLLLALSVFQFLGFPGLGGLSMAFSNAVRDTGVLVAVALVAGAATRAGSVEDDDADETGTDATGTDAAGTD